MAVHPVYRVSPHPYRHQGSHGCDPPDYGDWCKDCQLSWDARFTDSNEPIHTNINWDKQTEAAP